MKSQCFGGLIYEKRHGNARLPPDLAMPDNQQPYCSPMFCSSADMLAQGKQQQTLTLVLSDSHSQLCQAGQPFNSEDGSVLHM